MKKAINELHEENRSLYGEIFELMDKENEYVKLKQDIWALIMEWDGHADMKHACTDLREVMKGYDTWDG